MSIFNLMRDGRELARALRAVGANTAEDPSLLSTVIDPYVQVVSDERCPHIGIKLIDIVITRIGLA